MKIKENKSKTLENLSVDIYKSHYFHLPKPKYPPNSPTFNSKTKFTRKPLEKMPENVGGMYHPISDLIEAPALYVTGSYILNPNDTKFIDAHETVHSENHKYNSGIREVIERNTDIQAANRTGNYDMILKKVNPRFN